ncbi:MAG: hypothetical protein WCW93_00110 [Candidatus Paceibacterota bacterium]
MKKKINTKKGLSGGKIIAGVAGMAALGAGAYYFLGPKAKAHQKKAKILVEKMKKEVEKEIKKVKEVTPALYYKAIDVVASNYAKQYKLHEKDVKAIADKMKNEWKGANKIVKKAVREAKKKS